MTSDPIPHWQRSRELTVSKSSMGGGDVSIGMGIPRSTFVVPSWADVVDGGQ